jgi:hypothetical protein
MSTLAFRVEKKKERESVTLNHTNGQWEMGDEVDKF